MDKDTIILWELIQLKLENLKECGVVISIEVDERIGFLVDIENKQDADTYVLNTLNEVKAFISGVEVCVSLKLEVSNND